MAVTPGTQCNLLHRPRDLRLTKFLSDGGEGQVWETNVAGQVAKIFFARHPSTGEPLRDRVGDEPLPPVLLNKLKRMIEDPPVDPGTKNPGSHRWIAWPSDVIVRKHAGREIPIGFMMPRAAIGSRKILEAFNPVHRSRYFPNFSFNYLIALAHNIAVAFEALHDKGYVIGDVNDGNALVSPEGLVTVIDNDSFQVIIAGPPEERYLNPLGREPWQPPEYYEIDRRSTPRTAYMDRFGLAVLVHQILFSGEHPFQGKWIGSGDPPEDHIAIRDGHYVERPTSLFARRFAAVSRTVVSPEIMRLFESAFVSGLAVPSLRPTAKEWRIALSTLNNSLKGCPTYPNRHQFYQGAAACPWCDAFERGNNAFAVPITRKPKPVIVTPPAAPALRPVVASPVVLRSPSSSFMLRWRSSRVRLLAEAITCSLLLAVLFGGLRAAGAWSGAMPRNQAMTSDARDESMFSVNRAIASSVLLSTVLSPILLAGILRRRT